MFLGAQGHGKAAWAQVPVLSSPVFTSPVFTSMVGDQMVSFLLGEITDRSRGEMLPLLLLARQQSRRALAHVRAGPACLPFPVQRAPA